MKRDKLGTIAALFCLCSLAEYIEFLFIRTDQTIIADNIGSKIFCIFAVLMALKHCRLRLSDIGFHAKGLWKNVLSGFSLGLFTFGIAYCVEILLLMSQGQAVSIRFFITNFALTGASTQVAFTIGSLLICIVGNVINVLAEEGLFRGVILKLATDRFGFATANLIQAILFGLWHIVMVVLGVYDGLMNVPTAIVMGVGYVLLAAILGLEWGTCVSLTGTVWMGISEHFFNNFIGNTLHIVTESGTDEWQIVRVVFSNLLSLGIVLLISRRRGKRAKAKGPAGL